jgi:F-type H+-transporting ATPase subunit b
MLIDWFTVIAQAVNFLILVWLLKRFLYAPILGAIDAREKRINDELANANATKTEARTAREEFRQKNDEFDMQRAALINQATTDAAAERGRLLAAARTDSDRLRAKQQDMLEREYQNLHEEIARRTRVEVFAIARKTLTDLAGSSLEERMIDAFVQRLRGLDAEEKLAFKSSISPVLVRSAFELTQQLRAAIEGAIIEAFPDAAQVHFEIEPELISGIELTMQGRKIAWSVSDYLATLEKSVNELIKAKAIKSPDEHGI